MSRDRDAEALKLLDIEAPEVIASAQTSHFPKNVAYRHDCQLKVGVERRWGLFASVAVPNFNYSFDRERTAIAMCGTKSGPYDCR